MPDDKRVSIQFYMSTSTRKKLRMMAVERDLSMNDFLRAVFERGLKSEGIEIDMSEGLQERGGWKGGTKARAEE